MPDEPVSDRVREATGMVAAQAPCGLDEALRLLANRADARLQSLEHTALDVLDGIIRFDD
jgi:hypothetical protein